MGYSIHEWFDEYALPILMNAFDKIKSQQTKDPQQNSIELETPHDIFINALKEICCNSIMEFRKDQFQNELVFLGLQNEEDFDIFEMMKRSFNAITNDDESKSLLKVEYKSNFDKVCCEYDSIKEDYE